MNFQKLENGEILTDVDHILDIIKKKGKISVQELGRKLNRSTDCIEILVEVLEENNLIEKHFTLNKIFYTIKDEKKKNTVSNKSVKDVVKYTKLKINSIKNNQNTIIKLKEVEKRFKTFEKKIDKKIIELKKYDKKISSSLKKHQKLSKYAIDFEKRNKKISRELKIINNINDKQKIEFKKRINTIIHILKHKSVNKKEISQNNHDLIMIMNEKENIKNISKSIRDAIKKMDLRSKRLLKNIEKVSGKRNFESEYMKIDNEMDSLNLIFKNSIMDVSSFGEESYKNETKPIRL